MSAQTARNAAPNPHCPRMDIDQTLAAQDMVITRKQALTHLSESALRHRLERSWRILLPGVYLAATGAPSPRQRRIAALLYGGDDAQLADQTALAAYGVRYLPADDTIYLLVPATDTRVSRDGVRVRRTHRLPRPRVVDGLRHVPPARALAEFAARIADDRTACAVLADAVQRRIAPGPHLVEELRHMTGRGAGSARRVGEWISLGARSAAEVDFLALCKRSSILPAPLVNPLLELPSGELVSPDALFVDAALVHETNGREHHAADDRFDDMQARHGLMTSAGLTVLHSSGRQLRQQQARVLSETERCYLRNRGRGLPPGVRLLRAHAA